MRLVPIRPDRNAQALVPGALNQLRHFLLAAEEFSISTLGIEQEAFKIAILQFCFVAGVSKIL